MKTICLLAASAFNLLGSLHAYGNIHLPALFSDHMVLQRDSPVTVWGWADPGEQVSVGIAGRQKTATADGGGNWKVTLDPLKIGEAQTLVIKGKNTITIRDVLVGEVWLASGQSNMDYSLGWKPYEAATIASANDPELRYFDVPHKGSLDPQKDVVAQWQSANPSTVKGWSAVAYFYAKILRDKLHVPVAIIKSSYGGTIAEAWTGLDALSRDPAWKATAENQIASMRRLPEDLKTFPISMTKWMEENGAVDPGDSGAGSGWSRADFDDSAWSEMEIPSVVAKAGLKGGGIVWFRKSVVLPPAAAEKDFYFDLGWVNDGAVTVYFNGAELKPTTLYEKFAKVQLRFPVAKSLVRPGQPNTIAIRLHALTLDTNWGAPTSRMSLPVDDPKALDNKWKYHVEKEFPPLTPAAIASLPKTPGAQIQNTSGALFNAMINPLIPYAIKGAIWYQGESNTNPTQEALDYRRLLPALIADWRSRWGEGDFPFYIVQLANYGTPYPQPSESNWALLRESQSIVAATVPQTGMSVIIDIGEGDNIHPRDKKDVGYRLSLLALNRTYGQRMEDSGPIYQSMNVDGAAIRLSFTHIGGGLVAKGGPLRFFAIAGGDKKFVWADAKIEGNTVIVSSPRVPKPMAARYAWAR